uniref:Uncharacterized protein n=1 Tax=Heterorhabditis bacteriophora TaxID=37862 RepID=A0A1I7WRH8_HETBA
MEDSLEDRISAIENSLGINENTDVSGTSGPLLNDRLKAIEFCEDLIRRRVELLSEFDERLKVVLDTSKVSQVLNQDMTLNEVHDGVYHALEEWKKYTTEINKFKLEYFSLIAACQNYLDEIEVLVSILSKFIQFNICSLFCSIYLQITAIESEAA